MMKPGLYFLTASSLLLLAACGDVKEQFDFSKKAPDEFAIVTRAPLEMPKDINHLPTPTPGAPRPQEQSTDMMARETVLGESAAQIPHEGGISQGEALLLQRTGSTNANPAIRAKVDQETNELIETESPGIDKLKKMVGMTVEPPAKVVDPVAETNRLKQNKAQGKPITEGKTPTLDDQ